MKKFISWKCSFRRRIVITSTEDICLLGHFHCSAPTRIEYSIWALFSQIHFFNQKKVLCSGCFSESKSIPSNLPDNGDDVVLFPYGYAQTYVLIPQIGRTVIIDAKPIQSVRTESVWGDGIFRRRCFPIDSTTACFENLRKNSIQTKLKRFVYIAFTVTLDKPSVCFLALALPVAMILQSCDTRLASFYGGTAMKSFRL